MYNSDLSQKLKLIQISGEDNTNFLNSQLTQDIKNLTTEQAQLFAYCSPKGRMIANGIIYKNAENYNMLVDESISEVLVKKLSMYILRSKVKITIIDNSLYCISYKKIENENLNSTHKFLDTIDQEQSYAINWCDDKYIVVNYSNLDSDLNKLNLDEFIFDSIKLGIFFINIKNSEEYVPQMLNFEKLGGVNFKKGCYPGQEIIARSQYLGKIKKTSIYAALELNENIDIDIEFSDLKIQINDNNITTENNLEAPQIVESIIYQNKLHLLLCIRAQYLDLDNLTLSVLSKTLEYKVYFKDEQQEQI